MTNNELYDRVLEERYNLLLPNSLLLLTKIINFENYGSHRLQGKGYSQLCERVERNAWDLKWHVKNKCWGFLFALREDEVSYQLEIGGKGVFTPAGLNTILSRLEPFRHQSGFIHNLHFSFQNLVRNLNGAFTYQGKDFYEPDTIELARAFRLAAIDLEWDLAQHAASTSRLTSNVDFEILN